MELLTMKRLKCSYNEDFIFNTTRYETLINIVKSSKSLEVLDMDILNAYLIQIGTLTYRSGFFSIPNKEVAYVFFFKTLVRSTINYFRKHVADQLKSFFKYVCNIKEHHNTIVNVAISLRDFLKNVNTETFPEKYVKTFG